MGERVWSYCGHEARIVEVPAGEGTVWVVHVDADRLIALEREPDAVARAYAEIDRRVSDNALRPTLAALAEARFDVDGPRFDPDRDAVGVGAWVFGGGAWRRGQVTRVKRSKVEVAWMTGPKTRKVNRTTQRFEDVVVV